MENKCSSSALSAGECQAREAAAAPVLLQVHHARKTSTTGRCCFASADSQDVCGTCHASAWAEAGTFCAESEANCMSCSPGTATWCEAGAVAAVPADSGNSVPATDSSTGAPPASPGAPTEPPAQGRPGANSSWVSATYTTGYWDCCKPSCSWPGKGSVGSPVLSCDANSGNVLTDANVKSVCDGGTASSCANNQPFLAAPNLAMGFAAAAVSGNHGLVGDDNCGQCFELVFLDKIHSNGNWGGSHPDLEGKGMVVQVTNIGYDVNGEHSFDLQIPGAGQGIFDSGCTKQFPGYSSGDFDCDNNYGGCDHRQGCSRLPPALRDGCHWRYDWYQWLIAGGQTNNPYVEFRRVRCPSQLTDISGSIPTDDDAYPSVDMDRYQ